MRRVRRAHRLCSLLSALCLLAPAAAGAADPIPEGPDANDAPAFIGKPATQRPVFVRQPPRHPHMAPNGKSNLHVDAYQTDAHTAAGPLGRRVQRLSAFHSADCAGLDLYSPSLKNSVRQPRISERLL